MRIHYAAAGIASLTGLDWSNPTATVVDPDPFVSWQALRARTTVATLGGRVYARERYAGWRSPIVWTVLTDAERADIYEWWDATDGWVIPSALEWEGFAYLVTAPVDQFPLTFVGGGAWSMADPVEFIATDRLAT